MSPKSRLQSDKIQRQVKWTEVLKSGTDKVDQETLAQEIDKDKRIWIL
jgi:hypothetical protein